MALLDEIVVALAEAKCVLAATQTTERIGSVYREFVEHFSV
jgi:hypothetical protein